MAAAPLATVAPQTATNPNKMKELIASKGLPLGTTESGRAWCLKALHPADSVSVVDGIPDEDSYPVVVQLYNQQYTVLNPEPTSAGNWDVDVWLFAHPYIFAAVRTVSATGVTAWSTVLNNALAGTTVHDKRAALSAICERYRLSHLGVTAYLDSSAVSNNGMVACAQYMETPSYVSMVSPALATAAVSGMADYASRLIETWVDPPRTYSQLQQSLNPYMGAAREGMYVPYKLSQTSQQWQNASDLVVHANQTWGATLDGLWYK